MAKESGIRPSRTLAGSVSLRRLRFPVRRSAPQWRLCYYYGGKRCQFYSSDVGMSSHSFAAAMVAAFIASRQGCELQMTRSTLSACKKDWCKNTRIKQHQARCDALRRIVPAGDGRIVILAAFPQLRPGFDIGKPMKHAISLLSVCSLPPA